MEPNQSDHFIITHQSSFIELDRFLIPCRGERLKHRMHQVDAKTHLGERFEEPASQHGVDEATHVIVAHVNGDCNSNSKNVSISCYEISVRMIWKQVSKQHEERFDEKAFTNYENSDNPDNNF